MDQTRPRDAALQRLLQDDVRTAELYAMLPIEVQSMVQQNAQRLSTVEDVEHMAGDYIDGI